MMKGWKTWAGALVVGVSAVLAELGYVDLAESFRTFGLAVIAVGIGHKIDKANGSS